MKTKKLLRKIKVLLSSDQRAQLAKIDSLEKVLRKLGAKEVALREKLDEKEGKKERGEILRKLQVIAAQREKGEKLMTELEELRGSD
ncbi:MAG: hypothetical protein JRH19_24160 [Deltaproteobacteria bacterium]|nr:hypothetical protein [Deltaproteobacteria bacterium]